MFSQQLVNTDMFTNAQNEVFFLNKKTDVKTKRC